MELNLIKASAEHHFLLDNLMQFYIYDFSEWLNLDVMRNGSFEKYKEAETYWQERNKSIYLVEKENQYAGFVLVKTIAEKNKQYFSIAEFFILKKYRKKGLGKQVAFQVFDLYKGSWQVFQLNQNVPAQIFWHKVVSEYTGGSFKGYFKDGRYYQEFENDYK